jgi:isocitrate lyase
MNVPSLVVARTDSLAATLLTSDVDERDQRFCTGERSAEGFFHVNNGMDAAISRGLAYAPYSDLVWCETGTPDLDEAKRFADAVLSEYPDTMLAYNCSPSFNWKAALDDATIASFQKELGKMGYRFQFITLAGWHALNASMFELSKAYTEKDMTAYVELQQREFDMEDNGYSATRHQREVGAGYFDAVATVISGGTASTLALKGSTEEEQF